MLFQVIKSLAQGQEWVDTPFPRVTMCDMKIRRLGTDIYIHRPKLMEQLIKYQYISYTPLIKIMGQLMMV